MEAPQEEVPDHPQVYRLRGQVSLQREVPVRPEGRPGQGLDAMRYEDGYLIYCDFFQFVYFDSISREEDSRRNATQTKPVLSPHVVRHATSSSFVCILHSYKYTD